jgi:hypothetical protein
VRTDNPYRPPRLSATFEGWKLGEGLEPVKGPFRVEIRLSETGRRSRFKAMIADTLQRFPKDFPVSELDECRSYVECQFKRKVKDWEEIA